jgi:hypothetical protein
MATKTKAGWKYKTPHATLKLIREHYQRSIGNRPGLFTDEVKTAFVAQTVLYLMSTRYESMTGRLRPMGDYVEMYGDALDFLGFGDDQEQPTDGQ